MTSRCPAPGWRFLALVALTAIGDLPAQAPVVEKVEPPNWWANHSVDPVQLLIRGRHLGGARLTCAPLTCGRARVNANGTYALVDLRIPPRTRPGRYPLRLATAGGSTPVPFDVSPQLPTLGRFQGFGVDDAVYLLMPDRFANGDPANDRTPKSPAIHDRTKGRFYHGGDLAGIRARLPYLKALGVTALWFNPLYDNNDGVDTLETYDGQPTTGYHGYGAVDFYAVDEHLGSVAELKALVDAAHAQGLKIILDMVANHAGPYHPWVRDTPTPTWFHGTQSAHPNNSWQTWTLANPYAHDAMRRSTLDGWFINILPDLNQDDPEVARYLIQNTLWWVGMTGIDGIRQDTWPYVPVRFWRDWMAAIKAQYPALRVVGEVFDGDPAMLRFFEGSYRTPDAGRTGVDYLFDFPLFFPLREAFGQRKSVRPVAQMLMRDHLYADPLSMMPFLGLHDVGRFMHEPGATTDGLKLAFTAVLTMRGTPLLYYGDEIALPGGNDPDNRRDFPGGWPEDLRSAFDAATRTPEENAVWQHVQTLLQTRRTVRDLRHGALEQLVVTDQQFVYRRGAVVVAINNNTTPVTVTVPRPVTGRDVLTSCIVAGKTTLTIPARRSCVFVP